MKLKETLFTLALLTSLSTAYDSVIHKPCKPLFNKGNILLTIEDRLIEKKKVAPLVVKEKLKQAVKDVRKKILKVAEDFNSCQIKHKKLNKKKDLTSSSKQILPCVDGGSLIYPKCEEDS